MTKVRFGEGGCEKTRRCLDSYISNELLVETNHEVLRHLEGCAECTAELEARSRLRSRLKAAVERQGVPPELAVKVRERIRARQSRSWLGSGWPQAVAVAAGLAVFGIFWMSSRHETMPVTADRRVQDVYIQKVSTTLAAILRVGLGDHIHCAVFRKAGPPAAVEQMLQDLGPYQGLLPVVKAAIPERFRIIMAHQCSYHGRKFVHFTMHDGTGLVSLVIARKQDGEILEALKPAMRASGIPLYQAGADRWQVAGFEAGGYLAYVVSEMKGKTNLQVAADLAHPVREFLINGV
jgi:hypothetical protein